MECAFDTTLSNELGLKLLLVIKRHNLVSWFPCAMRKGLLALRSTKLLAHYFSYIRSLYIYVTCAIQCSPKVNLVLLTMLWKSLVQCVRCCERRGSNAHDVNYKWLG